MRSSLWFTGIAAAALSTAAIAQEMNSTPPMENPTDPAATGQPSPTAVDPNSTVPTGQVVPANTGMTPANPNVPVDPTAPVGTDANPVTLRGNVVPPPPPKANYPTCTKQIQDSCRNPGGK